MEARALWVAYQNTVRDDIYMDDLVNNGTVQLAALQVLLNLR